MKYYIMPNAWDSIIHYAKAAYEEFKTEIGGMAIIYKNKDDNWIIDGPCILKQEVSGANTSLDKEELANYYTKTHMKITKKHPDLDYRFLWWHSHHTMEAFWSGTDLSTIEEYSDGEIGFALVVNLKGEYKFRVSIWNPIEIAKDFDLLKWGKEDEEEIPSKIVKEVKSLCSEESRITTWNNGYIRNNNLTPSNQVSLWNQEATEEEVHEEEVTSLMMYDPELSTALGRLQELCDEYIQGTMDYRKIITDIKSMKKICDDNHLTWTIETPGKQDLYDACMYGTGPIQLIKIREVL